MKIDDFDALVARLEEHAERHPRLYRAQVAGVAAIGYGYLAILFIGGLLLLGACVALIIWKPGYATVKLGLIGMITGGVFAWSIAKGMLVRTPLPEGLPVTAEDAPRLFDLIEEARIAARAPRIHSVRIDARLNASMAQRPWFGLVGPARNHLVLGLPLLRALSEAQVKSVIAHELGHAGGDHGRFAAWIYRMRLTWGTVHQRVVGGGTGGSFLVTAFLRRYWPWLSAWTFVLARQQEYEADRAAAEAAGPAAGEALVRIEVAARAGQELYWGRMDQRCLRAAEPPAGFLDDYRQAMDRFDPAQGRNWLSQAWRRPTTRSDTHPSLRDRLRALGLAGSEILPRLPGPPGRNAAETLLGNQHRELAQRLDRSWREAIAPQWHDRHEELLRLAAERDALAGRSPASLSAEERWKQVQATLTLDGDEAARPLLDALILQTPPLPAALFHRGRIRLAAGDAGGLEDLDRAIGGDVEATRPACALAVDWLLGQGRAADARVWERRAEGFGDETAAAADERSRLPKADRLRAHQLSDAQLARLRPILEAQSAVTAAWLARVEVSHRQDLPWFLLILETPWWRFSTEEGDKALLQAVADGWDLPGQVLVTFKGKAGSQRKAAAKLGDAVYRRA